MPEFTAPGVYSEERGRRLAPIQGVSTSNFGTVGMSERGAEDEAILCTSFAQFQEQFGNFISDSMLAVQVYAFFANEGRRAYVVRVCRSDAAAAAGDIEDDVSGEIKVAACGGAEVAFQSVGAGGAVPDLLRVDLQPSSVTFRYYDTPVAQPATPIYTNPVLVGASTGPQRLAVKVPGAPFASSAVALAGFLAWVSAAAPLTAQMDAVPAATTRIAGVTYTPLVPPNVPMGFIDLDTGWMVLDFTIGGGVRQDALDVLRATGHLVPSTRIVTDDGLGALVGNVGAPPNRIDYDGTGFAGIAGAYEFSTTAAAARGCPVESWYTHIDFPLEAKSRGAYGNDVSMVLEGNGDSYDRDLGTYTKVNAKVYYDDPVDGMTLKEVFTGLVMDNASDPDYIETILEDPYKGSDWLHIPAPGGDNNFPGGLNAKRVLLETIAGGGDNPGVPATAGLVFDELGPTGAAGAIGPCQFRNSIQPYTLVIHVWISVLGTPTEFLITDDGLGNLDDGGAGILDPAGNNRVDYDGTATWNGAVPPRPCVQMQFSVGSQPMPVDLTPPTTPNFVQADYSIPPNRGESQTEDMTGGTDGVAPLTSAQVTSPVLKAQGRGVYALEAPDELMQVGIGDFAGDVTVSLDLITWAEDVKDKFIVLATPQGMTPTQAKDYKKFTLGSLSDRAAMYWPWVGVQDPLLDVEVFYPPVGWVAGAIARTDVNRTVSKAPAGVDDGKLNFTISLEYKPSQEEIGVLNQVGVNSLKDSEFTGRCIWGARTLDVNGEFRYIQARRFFMFVEKSVYISMWGFVFETIGSMLFERITRAVDGFLEGLLSQGYFPSGVKPDSYAVVCSTANNTPSTIAQGIVICDVYLATTTPGEFLWFRYQQLVSA